MLPHFWDTPGIDEFVLDYANREMAGIDFLANLPEDKAVQVGVLDIRSMMIESPEQVADPRPPGARARARRPGHAVDRLRHEAAAADGREDEAEGACGWGRDRSQGSRGVSHGHQRRA